VTSMPFHPYDARALPYKIAVLCYLYDEEGRLLLLHRRKPPNRDMYSPIGGKLEIAEGEGPHDCALREIREEASVTLGPDEIRMIAIVSERAYQGEEHWLIFLFEATRPIRRDEIPHSEFDEGRLEWHRVEDVEKLPIPATDREVMWPNVRRNRGGFFMVHIDCSKQPMEPRFVETWPGVHERRPGEA
jgi:8-oxo-dGTP diphosphatase